MNADPTRDEVPQAVERKPRTALEAASWILLNIGLRDRQANAYCFLAGLVALLDVSMIAIWARVTAELGAVAAWSLAGTGLALALWACWHGLLSAYHSVAQRRALLHLLNEHPTAGGA